MPHDSPVQMEMQSPLDSQSSYSLYPKAEEIEWHHGKLLFYIFFSMIMMMIMIMIITNISSSHSDSRDADSRVWVLALYLRTCMAL